MKRTDKDLRFFGSLGTTALSLLLFILISDIQPYASAQARTPALAHEPFAADEIPAPGTPMSIEVALLNSKDSNLTLRAFLTRDGKVMDIAFRELTVDQHDRLLYVATLNAPLVELSYQFFLYRGSDLVATSDRYLTRRECLPDVRPIDPALVNTEVGRKRLDAMRDTAARLQSEVLNYEAILGMIDELQRLTERKEEGKNGS